jgi:dUTP pyrophosphatase
MNMNTTPSKIKFAQSRIGKKPIRAYQFDAGIDFFVPTFTSTFIKDLINKNQFLLNRVTPTSCQVYLTVQYNVTDKIEKYIPENLSIVKFDAKLNMSYFELEPAERILIPSGIYCQMESVDRALIAANKSGVATKTGLVFGAQVVDSQYQGEIHISLINTSKEVVRIYEDMKVIQFVETPIYTSVLEFADTVDDLYNAIKSDRGTGGFGSSDKKMLSE